MTEIVTVSLGERSYPIHIGADVLEAAPECLPFDIRSRRIFVVTDRSVASSHAQTLCAALAEKGSRIEILPMEGGEQAKSLATVEKVVSWLLDHGVDRQSVLFAVGGGVIGDIAGFAASIVLRGIPFVQVPTTLLAQVDSSVGGKTGVNTQQGKNLVGSFYQPSAVLCDLNTLATLPRRELLAGYAEIAKYGLIDDASFFFWLENHGNGVIQRELPALIKAVATSCRKKAEIVATDERESGKRALLNLGHTFGHALEAAAGYNGTLLHGEAVAIGMVLAFRLSCRMGFCKEGEANRIELHLAEAGLPTKINQLLHCNADEIIARMKHDKKAVSGKIAFILARGIGKAFVHEDTCMEDVKSVIVRSLKGS